jgi:UDP-N-acetylglucosamine 2-epimerase (non-hydrolysing)
MVATLAAVKLQIPGAYVEAGLRSFDRSNAEKIKRRVTDVICDAYLASEPDGVTKLIEEGHDETNIYPVGI